MSTTTVIFAGLIAHFMYSSGPTAVLVRESHHDPVIAVTDPRGTLFLKKLQTGGKTVVFSLENAHVRIMLPPGVPAQDSTFTTNTPRLEDLTGSNAPVSEVPAGKSHPKVSAYVAYSGSAGTLSAPCSFDTQYVLKHDSGAVSQPFCAAKFVRLTVPTSQKRITIENLDDPKEKFDVPADSTIYVYNISRMSGGSTEYRHLMQNGRVAATYQPTGASCRPTCALPKIPFRQPVPSIDVECTSSHWP